LPVLQQAYVLSWFSALTDFKIKNLSPSALRFESR